MHPCGACIETPVPNLVGRNPTGAITTRLAGGWVSRGAKFVAPIICDDGHTGKCRGVSTKAPGIIPLGRSRQCGDAAAGGVVLEWCERGELSDRVLRVGLLTVWTVASGLRRACCFSAHIAGLTRPDPRYRSPFWSEPLRQVPNDKRGKGNHAGASSCCWDFKPFRLQ